MTINYNEYAATMLENRPFMAQLDADEMSKKDWKKYLDIIDNVARTAYNHTQKGDFAPFRSAVHALYTFLEMDTKILGIDSYTTIFLVGAVPYNTKRSKAYKAAEKAISTFKKAMKWAREQSKVEDPAPNSVIFPNATTLEEYEAHYFDKNDDDNQDYYNAMLPKVKAALAINEPLHWSALEEHLESLEEAKSELAKLPKNYWKDYQNPLKNKEGTKDLKHVPASIRKNIENTVADVITIRSLMTEDQIEKEQAQIQAGKDVTKAQSNARRDARNESK